MGKLIICDIMKKKKKKNMYKSKIIILLLFFLLIFSYFELTSDIRLGNILSDIIFSKSKYVTNYSLLDTLESEIISENEELKSVLEIDYSLTDFRSINASIIGRNNLYYLDELIINKGKIDGITDGCAVVNEKGVIGKVINTGLNISRVRLINSIGNISISVNNKNKILEFKNGIFYIRGINKKDDIKVGDLVVTNGLSNVFPKGLLIGSIFEIENEKSGVGYMAKVNLSSNIDNLRFVVVLKRKDK